MKKILITAAALLTAFTASAQDKKLNAIKQLFDTEKYSECIESVKKYNASNTSKPETFYYMGFSYFEVYKQNPAKESNLTLAENTVYKAVMKDKTGEVLQNFIKPYDELHQTMRQLQEKYFASGDKSKAGQHAQMSARIYKDTTEIYRRIFQPELFVVPITQGKTLAAYEGEVNQTDVTGRKQGVWIEKFPNGKRKSQINYENGKPKGDFYKFYQRGGGVKAHLYFFNDSLSSAILYAENGNKVAMGYYYNHQKDSLWQYFEADSIVVSEENYIRGIKTVNSQLTISQAFCLKKLTSKTASKTALGNAITNPQARRFLKPITRTVNVKESILNTTLTAKKLSPAITKMI
jgi:antitoxin component YwqK of YwqJK toxin-antitoxin module